ncbi:SDH family Clp fold serine proteinase [Pseudomonas sp. GL-B-26]|uniref:SDH family Clp fold serine proteinase n=1 Tax=Pseudomonas sp. GL-B-26 TaxID=2832394 RepID=UPI001CBEFB98|nr:hypothetical protein [Pseudomonas sp. GL-B-26]
MFEQRKQLFAELEAARSSKVISFITSDRPGLETQIAADAVDLFVSHLDEIGVTEKITLFLYTRGGSTLAAWNIVNLLNQFCDELEIIVPSKCHSAGTLMSLGAKTIVMTKQATLGPIDPSVNTPLNPQIEGAPIGVRLPVSVEAIKGYFELAKEEIGINNEANLTEILLKLSEHVHPLVLGEVYRSRTQIQMLARKLIKGQLQEEAQIQKVISFLCSDSGSHDYTINRREAKNELGLNIEKPSADLYTLINAIYTDIHNELQISQPMDLNAVLGGNQVAPYSYRRGLVESLAGGSHYFSSEGVLFRIDQPGVPPQIIPIQDQRNFEGWRHAR